MAIVSKDTLDSFIHGCLLLLLFILCCATLVGTVFMLSLAVSYGDVYQQNNCYEKTQSVTCFEKKGLF